nr:unnamed protein product [Digitaria exilis]
MPSAAHSFRDNQIQEIQGGPSPPDPYGLLGLLGVMRMNDAELSALALGMDLTTLGLNLNSTDNLYKTFGSPWSNEPAKGDPDFHIPACYFSEQTAPLLTMLFPKFPIVTLFYIFYRCNRGWFYHKELGLWLTRIPNVEPLVKTPLYERGSYCCFDPQNWDTVRKDNFVIHYELVEKRPALPSVAQNVR